MDICSEKRKQLLKILVESIKVVTFLILCHVCNTPSWITLVWYNTQDNWKVLCLWNISTPARCVVTKLICFVFLFFIRVPPLSQWWVWMSRVWCRLTACSTFVHFASCMNGIYLCMEIYFHDSSFIPSECGIKKLPIVTRTMGVSLVCHG